MQYEKNDVILEAQNVSKYFPIRGTMGRVVNHVKAVDGVSLTLRRRVQMVFQDPYTSLDLRQRIGDILMEVLAIQCIDRSREERHALVMETLAKVSLRPEHFYRFPHEFSGGQRQRVGLARADTEP